MKLKWSIIYIPEYFSHPESKENKPQQRVSKKEMHEERSGLVRQGALCPMCGLEANAIRPPVDGVARSLHVHWPFGEAKVLARTRQMVGSKPFPFPLFVCPSSLVASWKSFGLKLRRPDAAVAIPAEFRTSPASVVVHRSRPSVVPAGNPDSGDPLEPLRKVLGHPNPAFVCADSHGQHPASPIRIRNTAMPPATEADLKLGRAMLGKAASGLLKLFEVHNGVRLFEEPLRGEPGVRLAPIQEWEALTASCREGLPPTAPMVYWPAPPMLKMPVRNATETPSPTKISGTEATTLSTSGRSARAQSLMSPFDASALPIFSGSPNAPRKRAL